MTTQLARLPGWTAHIGVVAWSTHWRFSTLDLLFRDSENLSSRTVLSRIPVSRLLWRADQRRADRLCQAEEDHGAVAAEAGGKRRLRHFLEALVRHIPVVRHPNVTGGIDGDVRDDLQSADVASGR